jgi:7-cyano-7-deazaguanine synthase in queuosine biosynthesis
MAKDLCIVLNNGSLNSVVTTALAAQKYRPILLYVETHSQPPAGMRAAYDQQVAHFKPYREHTLSMRFLQTVEPSGSSSALAADPRHTGLLAPQLTRLLPLVATAVPFAAHYQAAAIYMGLRVGPGGDDLARATEYVQVCNELIQLPCGMSDVELLTPLLELEPWQVVDVGFQVDAPLERGWSCLEQTPDPCGICRGCRQREAAFTQAAKPDPLRPARKP